MSKRNEKLQREILPIPDIAPTEPTTYDAKDPDAKFPPIEPLRPPPGAPNILVVLIDDVGFGASSAFGGPCRMPTAEKLSKRGLKFTRFHTTALCSPTRAALLTGRNHHAVGMGSITEIATAAPGQTSVRPNTAAPIAEILKLNGYSTAQLGKCHEVPVWETSPLGPFDHWPSGSGFEYFYGFIGGEANQYYPALYEGTTPVEPTKTPEEGYHLTEDLADKAIAWTRQQKALMPDKPFFVYFAPGATHAPHHVPKEWADKYKGQFDDGWDAMRLRIFERQKKLGVIPKDAELTPRHAEIPSWEEMPEKLKPVLRREMEIYAGFLEHVDFHTGRLIDALDDLGVLEDTIVYYIIGDNGASAEGTLNGTFNEMINFNGAAELETPEFLIKHLDQLGGPESYNHYAVGWAHALCTPYQWTKQVASHWGGTRNATIVHWPGGIRAKGELRTQFHHVIDVGPTLLEVAGVPHPTMVQGVTQMPMHGVSMAYAFDNARAEERHETQYFEIFCNRGIYHKGWTAVTKHRTPWELVGAKMPPLDEDIWELYDTNTDWTQARNLAKAQPEKLRELQRLFLLEATKYNVFPLDDRGIERAVPEIAGRPTLIHGDTQLLFAGMGRLSENSVVDIKNKSHAITADLVVPKGKGNGGGPVEGVIVAQGGRGGGWSLYTKNGRLKYCYNFLGIQRYVVESNAPLTAGHHQARVELHYDGGGLGKGADVELYLDGKRVGKGRVEHTAAMIFSADETCDVGRETGSPVSEDYTTRSDAFTGTINWIQIDLGKDDHDHLISPNERFRIAMARQ